ncbi:MAG: LPXTG cell wall anchor domain-containing protein, partial [bacterium]
PSTGGMGTWRFYLSGALLSALAAALLLRRRRTWE